MTQVLSSHLLKRLAAEHGFSVVGVLSVDEAKNALATSSSYLQDWQQQGYAGEMSYMNRDINIFQSLENFHDNLKSVICFSASYVSKDSINTEKTPMGYGRVARYAWGKDYHRQLKKRLKSLMLSLEEQLARKINWRIFTDAVPLLERALAKEAFNGFIGKNTMLIQPGIGSYTFLAEVLLDFEIEKEKNDLAEFSCKTCSRCLSACPTKAFTEPYKLDARKCISYLTIEKKTSFSQWEQDAIGDWLFGCDICQEVCPFNHENVEKNVIDEFSPERGAGSFLKLTDILSIRTKEEFEKRFAGTPLMRAGRVQLLRNACAVVANTKNFASIAVLIEVYNSEQSDLIREQAINSLKKMHEFSDGLDKTKIEKLIL